MTSFMAYTLTCPSCQKPLRIPDGVKESALTCPRCLARIDNPAVVHRELSGAVTGSATCRSCGRIVEKVWGYCPFCRAALDKPQRVRRRSSVDKETHRDTAAIGVGLVVISLLGGLGIIFFFCGGGGQLIEGNVAIQKAGKIGMIISTVLFVTVIVGMTLASRSQSQGMRTGTIVTGAVTIPLLTLAGVLSWFIYVCGGCAGPDLFKPTAIGSDEKGRKK